METKEIIQGVVAVSLLGGIGLIGMAMYNRANKPPNVANTKADYFDPDTGKWTQKTPKETKADNINRRRSNKALAKAMLPLTQELDIKQRVPGGFFATVFTAGLNIAFAGPLGKTYNTRNFVLYALNPNTKAPSSRQGKRDVLEKYKFKHIPTAPAKMETMYDNAVKTAKNSTAAQNYYKFASGISAVDRELLEEDPDENEND